MQKMNEPEQKPSSGYLASILVILGLFVVFFAFTYLGNYLDSNIPETKYVIVDNKSDCKTSGYLVWSGATLIYMHDTVCSKNLAFRNGTAVMALKDGDSQNPWHYQGM